MLGWALTRGVQGAFGTSDAPVDPDTTQFEAPDTPAPIFAARAIRNAIFGTPAPADMTKEVPKNSADATSKDFKSPAKPNGILLTPGTATARRKRVSFDHDVKNGSDSAAKAATASPGNSKGRKKTTLQQALENSRNNRSKKLASEDRSASKPREIAGDPNSPTDATLEDEWEDDDCNPDVTLDLNEPHSKSGKYWKSEFSKYTEDARTEMEKLVKYKHLAKLYAEKKDAEALELNQKLKDEHEKVDKLEKKITDLTAQMAAKRKRGDEIDDAALMKKLAEKTALAMQYRDRAKELEKMLKEHDDSEMGTSHRRRRDTSPQTEKTLLEVQRELRKARSQLKEMKGLQEKVDGLKSDLLFAQQRATKLAEENKRLAEQSSQPSAQKLESHLRESKNDLRQKSDELRKLKEDYDTLKENAKRQRIQALKLLQEKDDKIAELDKEVRMLRVPNISDNRRTDQQDAYQYKRASQEPLPEMKSYRKPSQPLRRALSAEDLTGDWTQKLSFTGSLDAILPKDTPRLVSKDLSASLLGIEEALKKDKEQSMQRDSEMIYDDLGFTPSRHLQSLAMAPASVSRTSSAPRRVLSEALSDRLNERIPRANLHKHYETHAKTQEDSRQDKHDTACKPSRTRKIPEAKSGRPSSLGGDASGIDLIESRFARLGGPNVNNTALVANTPRCTLPADRLAAARARLERKRQARQTTGNRGYDKENVRP